MSADNIEEIDQILSEICPHGTTIEKARFVVAAVKNAGRYISLTDIAVAEKIIRDNPLPKEILEGEFER